MTTSESENDDEWMEVPSGDKDQSDELEITLEIENDFSDSSGDGQQTNKKKRTKMGSLTAAKGEARKKRADMRRMLLDKAHLEHRTMLLLCIAHLRSLARDCGTQLPSSKYLGKHPEHPHHPPSPLPASLFVPKEAPGKTKTSENPTNKSKPGTKRSAKQKPTKETQKTKQKKSSSSEEDGNMNIKRSKPLTDDDDDDLSKESQTLKDSTSKTTTEIDNSSTCSIDFSISSNGDDDTDDVVLVKEQTLPEWISGLKTTINPSTNIKDLSTILQKKGYITRPVVGIKMDVSWSSNYRKVGRFLETVADSAILGKAPKAHYLNNTIQKTTMRRKNNVGYRSIKRGNNSKKDKTKKKKKKGSDNSDSDDESLFSFESDQENTCSSQLIVKTVDEILSAEVSMMEDSVAAWDSNFLNHTPRDPLKAVRDAAEEEQQYYNSNPPNHNLQLHSWLEVFCPITGSWGSVLYPKELQYGTIPYVFAAATGRSVIDVTTRYATDYSLLLDNRIESIMIPTLQSEEGMWAEKPRLADGEDGDNASHPERFWLSDTIANVSRNIIPLPQTPSIEWELEHLRRLKYKKQPSPYHKELLKSKIFCAKSLLHKLEGIHPKARPFGKLQQYEIYVREDVSKLRTRDAWRKYGRQVRQGQGGVRKVAVSGFMREASKTGLKDVFGHWQTDEYVPTFDIANTKSISDGTKEGTFSLADRPLPRNLAHVPGSRVHNLCNALSIPYGKALISFSRSGGWSRPNFDGVVIPKEYENALREAVAVFEAKQQQDAAEKRSAQIIRRWELIVMHLQTRDRLRQAYL